MMKPNGASSEAASLQSVAPEAISRQLEIAVRRLADDLRYGQDLSPFSGAGIEYLQSRPFEDGDPVRDIDWRVTGRTGKFYVKQYEALKAMPVYMVVDTSASMAFSSIPFSKHKLAALLAGGFGLAALQRLSPVGFLASGGRSLHVRPSLRRARVYQWLHELRREAYDEPTCLAERIDHLSSLLHSRALVVIISDLHDPEAVPAVRRLAQRHEVLVLHVEDPAERGQLQGGIFHAVEAESGRAIIAHGRSRWFDEARQQLPRLLASAGIDYLHLNTDRPFVAPLRRLLVNRGGLVRNSR
jgi:uncharacterized protein (DUF58 family)